jgi:hypothetical protein
MGAVAFCMFYFFFGHDLLLALLDRRRATRIVVSEGKARSWPAKQIIKAYNRLPESNRPFANIEYIVDALDIKHTVKAANDHFKRYYDGYDWDCNLNYCVGIGPDHRGCPMQEYHDLRLAISGVQKALDKQKHELEIAGVSDGLTSAKELLSSLKSETVLINQVTRELTK